MTAQKFYTIEQLARALSVSRTAVEGRLARNTITPSTTDADGRPLFDEEYVAQLVSERQSRVRE